MGGHREAELLPQAGGNQSAGNPFTAAVQHGPEAQSPSSTVSPPIRPAPPPTVRLGPSVISNQSSVLVNHRLPSVMVLNSSVVSEGDRESAERFFIRHYQDCPHQELPQR